MSATIRAGSTGLFAAALAVERAVIATGISLPFGGSLIIVAARDG